MKSRFLAGVLIVTASGMLGAQAPGAGAGAGPVARAGGVPAAEMLLAATGRLQLTDQQVVRLAAIARRSEARRASMRTMMDSSRMRMQGAGRPAAGDTAARRAMMQSMRTNMERVREQDHADRRDAIAVLTPDQQARAWEMIAARGRAMRGAGAGAMRGGRGPAMRRGMEGRAMRERGMQPRPGQRQGRPDRSADRI